MMNTLQSSVIRPRRSLSTEEHDLGDERLIYCPKLEIGISLNCSAIEIWTLCDGTHTLVEIAQTIAQQLRISDPVIVEELLCDVEATITQLLELGLIEAVS